jgi:hypothetical protein
MALRMLAMVLLGAAVPTMAARGAVAHRALARGNGFATGRASAFLAWDRYLTAGPQIWTRSKAPSFTPAVRGAIWDAVRNDSQAQSLANPMIDYLLWRRSLNPMRFSIFHPQLSPALAQLLSPPPVPVTIPPPVFTPVPPPSDTAPQTVTPPLVPPVSQDVTPPAVPEPSSIILAAGMLGWGLWWRRRINAKLGEG